ncbi:cyclohexanone monooxygenase [Tricholoma matsutake]|nr:cyclohexanone monooxygenase [Tricholoma matsutake 945]
MTSTELSTLANQHLDVLIVGAGFSGMYLLYQLRKRGYSVKVLEAGGDIGGVWWWNCYPGARTDSDFCIYQFAMEDLWKDFSFTEHFPARKEVLSYIHYVDKKLDLRRDMVFNARVASAQFNPGVGRWTVTTESGTTVHANFFLVCTGFASKPFIPVIKGLDTFAGNFTHTALWPQEGIDLQNKRVGVVGTGASGVQVIQQAGPQAAHLTVFQRTSPITFPMRQRPVDDDTQNRMKEGLYPHILRRRAQTLGGFHYDLIPKKLLDTSAEERHLKFEELWDRGAFHSYLGTYTDVLTEKRANDIVYEFWRDKVRARINDPVTRELLAPMIPVQGFGAGRFPCLEQRFYEVFNQSNVKLINLRENPIDEILPKGAKTRDGTEHELDVLVFATGFDAVTGGIKAIDIRGTDGVRIGDKWDKKLSTYLGLMSVGYPNMFFPYGPHGPTSDCNGPTCIELQGAWIVECLEHMKQNQLTRIEPTQDAEDRWGAFVHGKFTEFFWSNQSGDGELEEPRHFTGGVPAYHQKCQESAEKGYKGFVLS